MHILLTGGTGLIGRALCRQWAAAGHQLTVLSRDRGVVVVGSGVQAGERVVSAGVNSLKPGQKIKLDEASRQ